MMRIFSLLSKEVNIVEQIPDKLLTLVLLLISTYTSKSNIALNY